MRNLYINYDIARERYQESVTISMSGWTSGQIADHEAHIKVLHALYMKARDDYYDSLN